MRPGTPLSGCQQALGRALAIQSMELAPRRWIPCGSSSSNINLCSVLQDPGSPGQDPGSPRRLVPAETAGVLPRTHRHQLVGKHTAAVAAHEERDVGHRLGSGHHHAADLQGAQWREEGRVRRLRHTSQYALSLSSRVGRHGDQDKASPGQAGRDKQASWPAQEPAMLFQTVAAGVLHADQPRQAQLAAQPRCVHAPETWPAGRQTTSAAAPRRRRATALSHCTCLADRGGGARGPGSVAACGKFGAGSKRTRGSHRRRNECSRLAQACQQQRLCLAPHSRRSTAGCAAHRLGCTGLPARR